MIDECPKRRRHEAAPGIIEKRARKAQPPLGKDRHQCTAVQMRPDPILEDRQDSATCDRRVDGEIGGATRLNDQRSWRVDEDGLAIALELPWCKRATGKPDTDAAVFQEIAGLARRAS